MSLYQYACVIGGWNRAQGGGATAPPTDDEFDEMLARSAADRARELPAAPRAPVR